MEKGINSPQRSWAHPDCLSQDFFFFFPPKWESFLIFILFLQEQSSRDHFLTWISIDLWAQNASLQKGARGWPFAVSFQKVLLKTQQNKLLWGVRWILHFWFAPGMFFFPAAGTHFHPIKGILNPPRSALSTELFLVSCFIFQGRFQMDKGSREGSVLYNSLLGLS